MQLFDDTFISNYFRFILYFTYMYIEPIIVKQSETTWGLLKNYNNTIGYLLQCLFFKSKSFKMNVPSMYFMSGRVFY